MNAFDWKEKAKLKKKISINNDLWKEYFLIEEID